MPRNWMSCRRCGEVHTNPASSSLCELCGPIVRAENETACQAEIAKQDELPLDVQLDLAEDFDALKRVLANVIKKLEN